MRQKIDKKNRIYIYLFILFLLSTFNNIQILNSDILKFKIEKVNVSGLSETNNLYVSKEIKASVLENIFFINNELILKILKKNNLIGSFEVKKIFPDMLDVKIKKTEFLGIINKNGNFYFIGSNGKLINFDNRVNDLPYVFGKVNIISFINFVNIIKKSNISFDKIKEIYFFPSGRWDIKTDSDKIYKLPNENILYKLNSIHKINDLKKFKSAKIIDLRFDDKIIFTDE